MPVIMGSVVKNRCIASFCARDASHLRVLFYIFARRLDLRLLPALFECPPFDNAVEVKALQGFNVVIPQT